MDSKTKGGLIVVGITAAAGVLFVSIFAGAHNKAMFLEEQIHGAAANIEVAEKRRVDLVYNLADVAEQSAKNERETLLAIAQARADAGAGDVESAQLAIKAVAEAYPELKASENYKQLMTELALTENQIAQYRQNYNEQVRAYNRAVRSFPNNLILGMMGYEKIDSVYTDYQAPEDAPQNLFGDRNGN